MHGAHSTLCCDVLFSSRVFFFIQLLTTQYSLQMSNPCPCNLSQEKIDPRFIDANGRCTALSAVPKRDSNGEIALDKQGEEFYPICGKPLGAHPRLAGKLISLISLIIYFFETINDLFSIFSIFSTLIR